MAYLFKRNNSTGEWNFWATQIHQDRIEKIKILTNALLEKLPAPSYHPRDECTFITTYDNTKHTSYIKDVYVGLAKDRETLKWMYCYWYGVNWIGHTAWVTQKELTKPSGVAISNSGSNPYNFQENYIYFKDTDILDVSKDHENSQNE